MTLFMHEGDGMRQVASGLISNANDFRAGGTRVQSVVEQLAVGGMIGHESIPLQQKGMDYAQACNRQAGYSEDRGQGIYTFVDVGDEASSTAAGQIHACQISTL